MRPLPVTTVWVFMIAPILALPAGARQENVGPSGAGPRPNAVRPYIACAASALAAHRLSTASKLLLMCQPPGAGVTLGVQSATVCWVVVLRKTAGKIVGLSDVDLALRVDQHIH